MTPKEVLDMAKENKVKIVDLRFMDYPGLWQHFSDTSLARQSCTCKYIYFSYRYHEIWTDSRPSYLYKRRV